MNRKLFSFRPRRLIHLILPIGVLIAMTAAAQEGGDDPIYAPLPAACKDLLSGSRSRVHFIEKTRPDFLQPKVTDYVYQGNRFAKPMKNQCSYGSCWAASALHVVEDVAAQNGVKVALSMEYLVATTLLQQSRMHELWRI